MPQGPIPVAAANLVPQGGKNSNNISASTVVKASPGTVLSFSVITAGSTTGTINDTTTTGAAATSNQIATIPESVNTYQVQRPCTSGIVVVPGTGQVVSVSYI